MNFVAESKIIIDTVQWVFENLGCPELFDKVKIEYNNSFTRRMGDAEWYPKKGTGLIRFSTPLWPKATEEERKHTIVHEACHIVDGYLNGMWELPKHERHPHGPRWKRYMRLCGQSPKRTHKVDNSEFKRHYTRTKYRVACSCREHLIGPTRYRRMRKGTHSYTCKLCGGKLHPIGIENKAANTQ